MTEASTGFEVLEILRTDDHAVVVSARERGTLEGRRVTLKVLRHDLQDESMLTRVRDEARMLGRLRHPSVVQVFRMHTYDGRPVLEMEQLQGSTVADLLARNPGGLQPGPALKIARRTAVALDAAFNRPDGVDGLPMRIIHRDISPAHLFVTVDGVVKVVDFALAKGRFPDRATESLFLVAGQGGYAAPEIPDGADSAPSVDVYALGLTTLQMFTGQLVRPPPIPARHDDAVAAALEDVDLPLAPEQEQQVKDLIREMCRYEPDDRPTHRVVAERLEGVLERGGFPHGLADFARTYVLLAWQNRERVPPRSHPQYRQVAFLDQRPPDPPIAEATLLTKAQVEERIWRIVSRPGWSEEVLEIRQTLLATGYRVEAPFIAVLDRANVPTWKFWAKEAPLADIQAALDFLKGTSSSEAVKRVTELTQHHRVEVAGAASKWLADRG